MRDVDQLVAEEALSEEVSKRRHGVRGASKIALLLIATAFLLTTMASPLAVSRKPMLLASLHKAAKK